MFFRKKKSKKIGLLEQINELSDSIELKLQAGEFTLPVLPVVATQVIGMASNENADLDELSNLIHQDQALAGHVLRISNSAFFAVKEPIQSLKDAIARLGMTMIGEMAAIVSIQGQVFQVPAFRDDVEDVWLHALLSAYYGKEIAVQLNQNPDTQFMCGLLHTVGKPILYQLIADIGTINPQIDDPNYALRNLVQRWHTYAGRLAAEHWKLPASIQASCAFYNNRWDSKEHRMEIGMCLLSSKLAEWCLSQEAQLEERIRNDTVLEEIEIQPEQVDSLLGRRQRILDKASALNV